MELIIRTEYMIWLKALSILFTYSVWRIGWKFEIRDILCWNDSKVYIKEQKGYWSRVVMTLCEISLGSENIKKNESDLKVFCVSLLKVFLGPYMAQGTKHLIIHWASFRGSININMKTLMVSLFVVACFQIFFLFENKNLLRSPAFDVLYHTFTYYK